MSAAPDISVVMSVYNGGPRLCETMDSVLSQEDVSLEFVVVNDGSTDETPQVLEDYAGRDSRVKILHRENRGLTKSLIEVCAVARGKYIARQDAGDVSLPGRLSKEAQILRSNPGAALVSCGSRFVGPEWEPLYEVIPDCGDLTAPLLALDPAEVKGPSRHGCTMFPKQRYEQVGGYRASFYFAQDLDLWVRLAETGRHIALEDVLYEASITLSSISSRYRKQQVDLTRLILQSALRRRNGTSDHDLLQKAKVIQPKNGSEPGRFVRAEALYFVGACLRRRRHPGASNYFQRAFLTNPFHLKAVVRLLTG